MADGDAGNEFLQNILNFGGDQDSGQADQSSPAQIDQQAQQVQAQVNQLKQAAKDGSWAVSEEAGNEFIKAIDNYLDNWRRNRMRFSELAQRPALGSSPYADQVGEHIQLVAEGDEQSARTQLEATERIMHDAREAIDIAKKQYKQADEEHSQELRNIAPE